MKLSEAIRLGAMMKPQAFGSFYDNGGSCALGAACDALGIDPNLETQFLFVPDKIGYSVCPECGMTRFQRNTAEDDAYLIVHLNDIHRWTREQIADWVETIEAQQEQPQDELLRPAATVRAVVRIGRAGRVYAGGGIPCLRR